MAGLPGDHPSSWRYRGPRCPTPSTRLIPHSCLTAISLEDKRHCYCSGESKHFMGSVPENLDRYLFFIIPHHSTNVSSTLKLLWQQKMAPQIFQMPLEGGIPLTKHHWNNTSLSSYYSAQIVVDVQLKLVAFYLSLLPFFPSISCMCPEALRNGERVVGGLFSSHPLGNKAMRKTNIS